MITKNTFELMARYNQWMNEKLYQVCAGISDQERKKDLGHSSSPFMEPSIICFTATKRGWLDSSASRWQ